MAPSSWLKNALICVWFVLKMTCVRVFSERIIHTTVFSYKVPTLRTQASERGIGWGLGWPVHVTKLVKFRPQLGLCHNCPFMLIGAISQLSLHVNIRTNYQKSLNKWKVEVKIKSDWLRRELIQSNQSGSKSKSVWLKLKSQSLLTLQSTLIYRAFF